ncbi:MAG TPA: cupin domain-containing protein [bacterium]
MKSGPPDGLEARIRARLKQEGLSATRWSNDAGAVYAVHQHPYAKVLYVLRGGITFALHEGRQSLTMGPGDRMDLPAGTPHSARVGPDGVVCLEAQRTGAAAQVLNRDIVSSEQR